MFVVMIILDGVSDEEKEDYDKNFKGKECDIVCDFRSSFSGYDDVAAAT